MLSCSGKTGDYRLINKATGEVIYLQGAPLNHKDGPIIGIPGQYDYNFYYYKDHNGTICKVRKIDWVVEFNK